MSSPIRVVFLASGRGSNFDALYSAWYSSHENRSAGPGRFEIQAVISDRVEAPVLAKARNLGIPVHVVPFPAGTQAELGLRRERHGQALLKCLAEYQPRFLVLGGFLRILPVSVIEQFRSERGYSRIVNIHPSLLPAFPGQNGYSQAFRYGAKVAGVTVHLVDEIMDHGPICAQAAFRIEDCRSEEEVEARGLALEHRIFAETLEWVLPENFEVISDKNDDDSVPEMSPIRRICVRPS